MLRIFEEDKDIAQPSHRTEKVRNIWVTATDRLTDPSLRAESYLSVICQILTSGCI